SASSLPDGRNAAAPRRTSAAAPARAATAARDGSGFGGAEAEASTIAPEAGGGAADPTSPFVSPDSSTKPPRRHASAPAATSGRRRAPAERTPETTKYGSVDRTRRSDV